MFSIDHIGVAVKSLAAAKGIYEKLGLNVSAGRSRRSRAGARGDGAAGREPAGIAGADLGQIPSLQNSSPSAARDCTTFHCACPTWKPRSTRLKKDGVRLVSDEIKVGAGGHRYVFVHPSSAGGVLLELVEAIRLTSNDATDIRGSSDHNHASSRRRYFG